MPYLNKSNTLILWIDAIGSIVLFFLYYFFQGQWQNNQTVIPAKAGIQNMHNLLDPRFREGDSYFRVLQLLLLQTEFDKCP
jgi:hypothetical protein